MVLEDNYLWCETVSLSYWTTSVAAGFGRPGILPWPFTIWLWNCYASRI